MKEIKLIPALELGNKLNVDVIDFPDGRERKRCGITVDYSRGDIQRLHEQGLDEAGMREYYRQRIYDLVKLNISQDWECTGGMEEVLDLVAKHLEV